MGKIRPGKGDLPRSSEVRSVAPQVRRRADLVTTAADGVFSSKRVSFGPERVSFGPVSKRHTVTSGAVSRDPSASVAPSLPKQRTNPRKGP